jgi:hypothetical protein
MVVRGNGPVCAYGGDVMFDSVLIEEDDRVFIYFLPFAEEGDNPLGFPNCGVKFK